MENLFNKKFVHFLWEDELEGKKGFFADDINVLKDSVNNGDSKRIGRVRLGRVRFGEINFPFNKDWNNVDYRFFYYDPNYECKCAYAEGKQIQYELDGEWYDLDEPNWDSDYNFRIKPEEPKSRRMTFRELTRWLAKGNGQYLSQNEFAYYCITGYTIEVDDRELPEEYKIRKWGSNEWIEPTYDVYEKGLQNVCYVKEVSLNWFWYLHEDLVFPIAWLTISFSLAMAIIFWRFIK